MMIIESLDVVMSSYLGLDEGMALRRPDTQHEHGPRHRSGSAAQSRTASFVTVAVFSKIFQSSTKFGLV